MGLVTFGDSPFHVHLYSKLDLDYLYPGLDVPCRSRQRGEDPDYDRTGTYYCDNWL